MCCGCFWARVGIRVNTSGTGIYRLTTLTAFNPTSLAPCDRDSRDRRKQLGLFGFYWILHLLGISTDNQIFPRLLLISYKRGKYFREFVCAFFFLVSNLFMLWMAVALGGRSGSVSVVSSDSTNVIARYSNL